MMLDKILNIDYSSVEKRITEFLSEYLETSGARGYVVGLSGGVDSSTAATLAVKAVGSERVIALLMPDPSSTPKEDVEDAKALAESLGVDYYVMPIDRAVSALAASIPIFDPSDRVALGNLKARVRMIMLYYVANRRNLLVLGSGDRSEILLGYFTKYGDGGVDLLPIGDLYKTQVRRLARHLGVPERIAFKPSSPRLWPGQTAEGELGLSYEEADQILYAIYDLGLSIEEAVKATRLPRELVERVVKRVEKTAHKRSMPPTVSLKGLAHP
ncbi:MAG: NAD(+) synthetase [Thermoprotei archaeon]|nr:MAG: NAD(+) synthetase [Thermoprotei archaeon]